LSIRFRVWFDCYSGHIHLVEQPIVKRFETLYTTSTFHSLQSSSPHAKSKFKSKSLSQGLNLSSIATEERSKSLRPNFTASLPKRISFLNQTVRNIHFINVCAAIKNEKLHFKAHNRLNISVFAVHNSQSVDDSKSMLVLHLRNKMCSQILLF